MNLALLAACASLSSHPAKDQGTVEIRRSTAPPPSNAINIAPPKSRFQLQQPLPSIPGVMMDTHQSGWGLANQAAKAKGLQARVLWVDCTANIDRFNEEQKIVGLVARIKDSGFNTVVFDIKPISGQVAYFSKIAPKIKEWRGKVLPDNFDPLAVFVRECKSAGLSLLVSLNAFSEGHSMFRVGPGYDLPEQQTVLYDPQVVVKNGGVTHPVSPVPNKMPEYDDQLGVFTDQAAIPPPAEGLFAVTLGKDSRVIDGFEQAGIGQGVPTITRGGCAIVGKGRAADFLRRFAIPGQPLTFETVAEFVPMYARPDLQYPLMMNPHHPDVQRRALDILKEVAGKYAVDGILYDDRLRYAGFNADFSIWAKGGFERWLGKRVNWPRDVYEVTYTPAFVKGLRPGPYYDAWLTWRAMTMRNFIAKAKQEVKSIRRDLLFGVYTGSWYGEYPNLGVNYASTGTEGGFWFLTPSYQKTGYSEIVDIVMSGCYYPTATIYEAMTVGVPIGVTVEAAGVMTNRLIKDRAWTYASIALSQFKGNPEGLQNALQAACAGTQGVMVFDLSHEIDPFWPVFKQSFSQPRKPPHLFPTVLHDAMKKRQAMELRGEKEKPMIIITGAPGAGQ